MVPDYNNINLNNNLSVCSYLTFTNILLVVLKIRTNLKSWMQTCYNIWVYLPQESLKNWINFVHKFAHTGGPEEPEAAAPLAEADCFESLDPEPLPAGKSSGTSLPPMCRASTLSHPPRWRAPRCTNTCGTLTLGLFKYSARAACSAFPFSWKESWK